ncbi:hypothetical protein C8J57DRAFT_1222645 [Mycena rebaudengoi]|nr:hypothetical protein C8J57DRAFT_1222645 [Mycena rebaudengoi]
MCEMRNEPETNENTTSMWLQHLSLDATFRLVHGVTDGEGVEARWAYANISGPLVKEMGPGTRRDMLDMHVIQRPAKAVGTQTNLSAGSLYFSNWMPQEMWKYIFYCEAGVACEGPRCNSEAVIASYCEVWRARIYSHFLLWILNWERPYQTISFRSNTANGSAGWNSPGEWATHGNYVGAEGDGSTEYSEQYGEAEEWRRVHQFFQAVLLTMICPNQYQPPNAQPPLQKIALILRFFRTIHITLGAAGDVSRAEVEDIESGAVVSAFDGNPMEFFAASESTRCWSVVQIRNERETTSSPHGDQQREVGRGSMLGGRGWSSFVVCHERVDGGDGRALFDLIERTTTTLAALPLMKEEFDKEERRIKADAIHGAYLTPEVPAWYARYNNGHSLVPGKYPVRPEFLHRKLEEFRQERERKAEAAQAQKSRMDLLKQQRAGRDRRLYVYDGGSMRLLPAKRVGSLAAAAERARELHARKLRVAESMCIRGGNNKR